MRRSIALIAVLVLTVAVAACGDDTSDGGNAAEVNIAVTVAGGTVTVTVDGAAFSDHVAVPKGSTVHLTVTSDVADEAHIHGYDLMVELEAGVEGSLDFTVDIPGIFEMELEGSALHLIDLEVS
ncbi:MAG: hypothetical protein A2135_03315 [Actinobacteria bacterium RBG_16_67_15]|nr:MAG: hypothetical protein A2135_03315 [Actinobacteria bacterium RBG_16_67_15]